MRIIALPGSDAEWANLLLVLALIVGIAIAITVWKRLRSRDIERLLKDPRYHQALAVYIDHLRAEEPTRDDRREAVTTAIRYLVNDLGVSSNEAGPSLRLVVAAYDREQSYELRHQAIACEEAGDHEAALAYFERAARLQEEHDPKDHEFLLRCIARVRAKVRS